MSKKSKPVALPALAQALEDITKEQPRHSRVRWDILHTRGYRGPTVTGSVRVIVSRDQWASFVWEGEAATLTLNEDGLAVAYAMKKESIPYRIGEDFIKAWEALSK